MNRALHALGFHAWTKWKQEIESGRIYSVPFRQVPEGGWPYQEKVQYRVCLICGKQEKETL